MFKLSIPAAILALVLGVAACTGPSGCATTTPGAHASAQLTLDRSMYLAELGFDGLTRATEAAVDSGLLTGQKAADVRTYYTKAHDALLAARTAYRVGNLALASAKLAEANNAMADTSSLLPAPKL